MELKKKEGLGKLKVKINAQMPTSMECVSLLENNNLKKLALGA